MSHQQLVLDIPGTRIRLHTFSKPEIFPSHVLFEYEIAGFTSPYILRKWYFHLQDESDWEVWNWDNNRCLVDTRSISGNDVSLFEIHEAIKSAIERDGEDYYARRYEADWDAINKATKESVPW